MRRAVFLDRDGVINRTFIRDGKPVAPTALEELEILPGVAQACERLKQAGYVLIVVTNQPDIKRGITRAEDVEAVNQTIRQRVALDDFRICYHDDDDACECRKPKPGLLLEGASKWDVDLSKSFMVGDRWRDIEAGRRAGCHTIFVDHGYQERKPDVYDYRTTSLEDAARWIVSRGERSD